VTGGLYIGLDLGTSSLKGVVVTAKGEIVARGQAAYRTVRDEPGQAEQDPGDWVKAMRRVVRQIAADAPPARWRALGLSGMIPTLVLADATGTPTGPAVTWEDARAGTQGAAFRGAATAVLADEGELYRRTGQRVDGRYLLPMLMRLRESDRVRVRSANRLMGAKDYLYWWLTGECATDPSTATGSGCYDLAGAAWIPELAAIAGAVANAVPDVTAGRPGVPSLPAVLPPTTLRALRTDVATRLGLPAGLPVCLGAADSVLGMLALGATRPGDVAYVTGTSTVIAAVSGWLTLDAARRCLVTPLAGADGWGLEMDLVSTGSAVGWLARLLGLGRGGERKLMELAAEGAATRHPRGGPEDESLLPSFLPFLGGGEQGALWDPDLRGSILGLDLSHGPADLAAALVEGIVLESCRCLDVFEQNGLAPAPLRAAGAGASSPFLRRQLADASGRDVLFPADAERSFSALGAALIAARALGEGPADAGAWAGPMERTTSDPSRAAWWKHRRMRHDDAVERLGELYRCC
jgi:xylulokinase